VLLRLQDVTFAYDQACSPLFVGLTLHFAAGWTGIVGANGRGKTTLLKLACQELAPGTGQVQCQGAVVFCAQRTDQKPEPLDDFVVASDRLACRLRGRLCIEPDWPQRWSSLSHGERKRAQIAVALWQSPEILALDEPTNHIDAQARALLLRALAEFGGIGLLVSHDEPFLRRLTRTRWQVDKGQVTVVEGWA